MASRLGYRSPASVNSLIPKLKIAGPRPSDVQSVGVAKYENAEDSTARDMIWGVKSHC